MALGHPDDLLACPWGCGLAERHLPAGTCPPQMGNGEWANSVNVALGIAPQLRADVVMLKTILSDVPSGDRLCSAYLTRRIRVLEQRLGLMG